MHRVRLLHTSLYSETAVIAVCFLLLFPNIPLHMRSWILVRRFPLLPPALLRFHQGCTSIFWGDQTEGGNGAWVGRTWTRTRTTIPRKASSLSGGNQNRDGHSHGNEYDDDYDYDPSPRMVTGEYESPSPTPFRNRFASAALVSQERNASTDSVSNRVQGGRRHRHRHRL